MFRCVCNLANCVCFILVCSFLFLAGTANTHASSSASMNASVTIDDSLTLNITRNGTAVSNITLSLDPASNPFAYQDLDIAVGTNNETGYQLTVTTPNDATNLVNTEDSSATIPTISTSGNYTASNFPVNQWGYKNGTSNNYIPFASNTIILQKDTRVNNDTTTLRFASRIDYTKKSGLYSTTLAFTVVANPVINYMQDMDPALCTTTPTTVVDKRDNKEYTIARLANGQCWMTSDLNLAGGTKLYSETSDVPSYFPESGGRGYFTLPASSTTGFDREDTASVYNSGNETTNQADCNNNHPCNSYYSWLAATAGGKGATGTAITGDGYNAPYSICPKGWRLPTATTSNASAQSGYRWKTGDFYKVASVYGANLESDYSENAATFYNNAGPGTTPNFLLAGYYYSSTFGGGGTYGYYWSSSSGPSTGAYALSFRSSNVYSAYNNARRFGFSVRCILADTRTISDITYMQDINNDILANTANGTTKTLKDARDNKKYTVAKLADGKVWMTSNLNLAGGTKLYSETSDVPSGYPESGGTGYFTLPASSSTGFSDDTTAYVYNTGNESTNQADCNTSPGCNSYYSWLVATAGGKDAGGTAVTGDGYNAPYSICPKGWRLPTATTSGAPATISSVWKTGDNYKLASAYGANLESSYYENAATFYNNAGPGTLPNFLLAGGYDSGLLFYNGGAYGYYWSSSSYSSTSAYYLSFSSSYVSSAGGSSRRRGFSVRCMFSGV